MSKTLTAKLCKIGEQCWAKNVCSYFPLTLKAYDKEFNVKAWDKSMTDLNYLEEGDFIKTVVEDSSFVDHGKVHIEFKTREGITKLSEEEYKEPGLKIENQIGIITCLDIHEASTKGYELIAIDSEEILNVREAYYKSTRVNRKALRTYVRISQNHPALNWLKKGDRVVFSGFVDPSRTDRTYVTTLTELRRI